MLMLKYFDLMRLHFCEPFCTITFLWVGEGFLMVEVEISTPTHSLGLERH